MAGIKFNYPWLGVIWFVVPIISLIIAMFPMSSGYYTYLRWIVFLSFIFSAFFVYHGDGDREYGWIVWFGIIAFVFNPFIPIYLYFKPAWIFIDIVAILSVVLFFIFYKFK